MRLQPAAAAELKIARPGFALIRLGGARALVASLRRARITSRRYKQAPEIEHEAPELEPC